MLFSTYVVAQMFKLTHFLTNTTYIITEKNLKTKHVYDQLYGNSDDCYERLQSSTVAYQVNNTIVFKIQDCENEFPLYFR